MARTRTHKTTAPEGASVAHVAAYLRVSTDEQAESGLGLGDQRARCEAMAVLKGWPAPVIYADEGISGTKEPSARPALARLLDDVHAGKVDAVIVRDLSRLARKTRLVLDLVEYLEGHDVKLASCRESLDTTTPAGAFVLTMFAALAQLEREQIAERTKGALDERGRRDGEKGGRLPYGYLRSGEGLQVDPDAAAVVRRIYGLHRRGLSLRQIAARLNDAGGMPGPRGGKWHHTSIVEILDNRAAYMGGYRGHSLVRWPAILGKSAAPTTDGEDAA